MGPIGTYDTSYKYTYEGKEGKLDKIKVDTTLKYSPPGAGAAGALPFTIVSADLKSSDAKGTVLFDSAAGRLDSSEMGLKLAGKLTVSIGGMNTDVELTQEQKTTVRTTTDESAGDRESHTCQPHDACHRHQPRHCRRHHQIEATNRLREDGRSRKITHSAAIETAGNDQAPAAAVRRDARQGRCGQTDCREGSAGLSRLYAAKGARTSRPPE